MSNQEQNPISTTEPSHKVRAAVAGLALAGGLVGVGMASSNHNAAPKQETASTQESDAAFMAVVEKVANQKIHDTFTVAHAIINLKEGATITDLAGNKTVLTQAIDGIQNPAYTPRENVLCFMPSLGEAYCFDKKKDADNMTVLVSTKKGPQVISANALTPYNAATAIVVTVEGDGYGYGKVDGSDEYVASRPNNEGDTIPSPPGLPVN